jgi:8-oxo-dGTP pyrophosphatase MutT (NUDIX family)
MSTRRVVRAAGGVITRLGQGGALEVLLVHRPHREDWTFPKGKVEAGETEEACAVREVEEETGLRCRLGRELPHTAYTDAKGRPKRVRYWIMHPQAGVAEPRNEIDAVRWVPLADAPRTLTYERDRALLDVFRSLDRS